MLKSFLLTGLLTRSAVAHTVMEANVVFTLLDDLPFTQRSSTKMESWSTKSFINGRTRL